jgi:transposase
MARRDIPMNEVVETIYQWHKGMKIQHISLSLGLDRKTVRKYLGMARSVGITQGGPLPDEQELAGKLLDLVERRAAPYETPALDLVARYRSDIAVWLKDEHMTARQVWRLLKETRTVEVGYTTIKRYLRTEFSFGRKKVTVRIETAPGEEAQVDFGYCGLMHDPVTEKNRRAWVFIMTLSSSRHKFIRFVFRQDTDTWLDCHERAFAFFGGVPRRIILDNLKAGVLKADLYDPTMNRAYADMERSYGFVADPARIRTPEHKGKVERAVPVVRKHLLAGRTFRDITEANERALHWCREEIGMEIHGTTKRKPYLTFLAEEKGCLIPLPSTPFERPLWKECTVHPDHHIVFDKSYYSLPTRYIGKKVWAKGMKKTVEIFLDHERIKVHPRSLRPGQWVTDRADYPPDTLAFLMSTPTWCRKKASEFGPHTEALVTAILKEHAIRNLRKAQAILRLADKHSEEIENVSERALLFGNTRYKSIKTMLEQGMTASDGPALHRAPLSEMGQRFLREPAYFAREVRHG